MDITLENLTEFPRAVKAMELHKTGYNCAQAVFLAFSDHYSIDDTTAALIAGPMGGGVGGQREVCGAVSGMALVLGMLRGYSDPADKDTKAALYNLVQQLSGKFKEIAGSVICRTLLGLDQPADPISGAQRPASGKIPCRTLVGICAAIVEQYLAEGE